MLHRRIIRHLQSLTVSQGYGEGEPLTVWPWQKRFIRGAFAPGVSESVLTVGRGAGKTTLIAGLGVCCLAAEGIAERNAEIIIVASSMDQGGICFRHMLRFLNNDRKAFRIMESKQAMAITARETGVRVRVLPATPSALHGAAPSLIIGDELAQWPHTKMDRMLTALRTSGGKVKGSRLFLIGTRAESALHPFETAIKTADFAAVYSAGKDDPPFQKRTWIKGNPSVRHNPILEDAYRREAKQAKRSAELLQQFRSLRLNQGIADTVQAFLCDVDTWTGAEGEAAAKGSVYWGLDLGGVGAACAVAAYWPTTGRLETLAAFGSIPDLRARGEADGVGRLYVRAQERGEVLTLGGRIVPVWQLLKCALRRFGRPLAIAADRWRVGELADAMQEAGLYVPLDQRGMGYRDGAQDVRAFRNALLDGRVTPVPSLFLTACMAEARTVSDPAGNAKLAKSSEGGRRQRSRDDAAAAAILAVALGQRAGARPARKLYHGRVG